MRTEADLLNSIRRLSVGDVRLFRNQVGTGWQGKTVTIGGRTYVEATRCLHSGLCAGSPDLVGWRSVVVTADMVGTTLAVFAGIEVKREEGRTTPQQAAFLAKLRGDGGLCGVARNVEDAMKILNTIKRTK